jgi:hypothetical protein
MFDVIPILLHLSITTFLHIMVTVREPEDYDILLSRCLYESYFAALEAREVHARGIELIIKRWHLLYGC